MAEPETTSRGVDALIARLRKDGVDAGRAEAERLTTEAKAEAAQILTSARREADDYLAAAKRESDAYVTAGERALETAMRDVVLRMRGEMTERFRRDVARLVTASVSESDLLRQMILEVAGRAGAGLGDSRVEVILPARVVGADEIRDNADDVQAGAATQYVLGLTRDMLREGVTLRAERDMSAGIRVRVPGDDVELDLSDEAIAGLLIDHLQPRFQAVMDGVIRGKNG